MVLNDLGPLCQGRCLEAGGELKWGQWVLDDFTGPCEAGGDPRSLPARLRGGLEAAPALHIAGSDAPAPRSYPRLPRSAVDIPQRPQRARRRPGGSDG